MLGNPRNALDSYAQIGVESAVRSADPHRLIILLFEGAESAISLAKTAIEQNNQPTKSKAISQAIDIVTNGLCASLDTEAGGDLASKLTALYDYIGLRLLHANLKSDVAALDEAAYLLGEIHDAWRQIAPDR